MAFISVTPFVPNINSGLLLFVLLLVLRNVLIYIVFICGMQLLFIDVGDAVAKVTCIIGPPVTRWLPKQTIAS